MLKKIDTPISDLFIIIPDNFKDARGYFFEAYSEKKYHALGLTYKFVQDNISKSVYGTVRGLHYQVGDFAQGKLCQVILGKVLDVAVDIRFGSPTFGKYFSVELSAENNKQLWIPPGFAHGFSVLSEEAIFHYKCTNYYSKKDERCIIYNDKSIGVNWKVENPIISNKDKEGLEIKNINKDFLFNKEV
jgi:dTDP-4-dehydrorhamnose 3,5-epimerase